MKSFICAAPFGLLIYPIIFTLLRHDFVAGTARSS